MIKIKLCGMKTKAAVDAAVAGGAAFLGFNFYKPSPRFVSPESAAALAPCVPAAIKKVALFVDADDAALESTLAAFPADMLQLHGKETPARVAGIKRRFNLPVIKAFGIAEQNDLNQIAPYETLADYWMFDAKAPEGAPLPGGNAVPFDWGLLKETYFKKPWFLAGGLDAGNVHDAVAQSGATYLDIASGIERVRGEKDIGLINELLELVRQLNASVL